ncbi:NAD(P)-dependent oxidoreductase [Helicobacter jaachi]|uniref:NAD(P)-dependent oxidoreductase n=1 Tax=Helicobacter jaachi TaxID=1677920 RepID=A0A4U8TC77_9HELI|nr:NAD(P)H-binding protein [Helicobacter jaachi]TLD97274.1 NAD(P)-dependent oxidoreductase [Helicobacter jaachi]
MNRRNILRIAFVGLIISVLSSPALGESKQPLKTKNTESKPLKVAILAASGKAGLLITKECVNAGFEVTAIVRNAQKMQDLATKNKLDSIKIVQKDIFKLESSDLQGYDAIVDAFGEWRNLELYKTHIQHLSGILQNNAARLIVVGGAGSLYMDKSHTTRLMDSPDFPREYLPVAKATAEGLAYLRTQKSLNWVYVSPPADFIYEGARTKRYKIIGEEFEVNAKGESKGSYADFALGIVDIIKDSKINKMRVGIIGL